MDERSPVVTTQVIELTPAGRAAVAVVLVDGPGAAAAVDQCVAAVSGRSLTGVPIGQVVLGRLRASSNSDGEEVIVCQRSPERVEVHCHGGTAAVEAVTHWLVESGCWHVAWPEWVREVERDSICAAARVALAKAATSRVAAILLDQYQGALSAAVRDAIAAVTAERWRTASESLDRMLAWGELGTHLMAPWKVVIAGPPNVGKSSLLNTLAGFGRAIVSNLPGTTRDVVTFTTAIDGWPVQLADTAGLRDADDALEAAGIALADEALADADLVLDVREANAESGLQISSSGAECVGTRYPRPAIGNRPIRVLHVLTKCDLIPTPAKRTVSDRILTSAVTREGIVALLAAVGQMLVPHVPAVGVAVPFTDEQVSFLNVAHRAIDRRDVASARDTLQALLSA